MREISRDTIKVGDIIGVPRPVYFGWGNGFRYKTITPETVIKISPKKNVITTNKASYDKKQIFCEIDEQAKNENKVAEAFINLRSNQLELEDIFRRRKVKNISDETIIEVSELMDKLIKKIKSDEALNEK